MNLMSMRVVALFIPVVFLSFTFQSDYSLYDKKGKEISYKKFLNELKDADVILFGELHDNTTAHNLQLNLLRDLYAHKLKDMVIGAEMFEADDQLKINELLDSLITYNSFEKEAKLWNNYTDYKPLLDFCIQKDLSFIGTNIPRRYANLVARKGLSALDSLSPEAKKYVAPLPLEIDLDLPGYKALSPEYMHAHGGMVFIAEAQAVKDATMAHFILENFTQGKLFFHLNGAYHSDNYEGIYWMLKKKKPELKIVTISTVVLKAGQKPSEEMIKKADFLLVTKEE